MNVKTNAEKEWLRKINGGMPMHKDTEAAPVRAEYARKECKPTKNEGRGSYRNDASLL